MKRLHVFLLIIVFYPVSLNAERFQMLVHDMHKPGKLQPVQLVKLPGLTFQDHQADADF